MREISATNFRKSLFQVLGSTLDSVLIKYRKGDAILMSVAKYTHLSKNPRRSNGRGKLLPLIKGRILKSLGAAADRELADYMDLK